MSLCQVAEAMQTTLPTACRFFTTLQAVDLIEKEAYRTACRIAPRVLELGYGVITPAELWSTAHLPRV